MYGHLENDNVIESDNASPQSTQLLHITSNDGSVVEHSPLWVGNRGFKPRPLHTKDIIKIVPDASLLSAQHI